MAAARNAATHEREWRAVVDHGANRLSRATHTQCGRLLPHLDSAHAIPARLSSRKSFWQSRFVVEGTGTAPLPGDSAAQKHGMDRCQIKGRSGGVLFVM